MLNKQKIAIIGLGMVGSSIAFSLMQEGIFSEIVLIDKDRKKAKGEAMDLSHGIPFCESINIYEGDYDDIKDCYVVIITAGANQEKGETRLDLIDKNLKIYKSIIPNITKTSFEGILLVVSNPVDILTYVTLKLSGYDKKRVIGSGTVLDSARFQYMLGRHLNVDSKSIHAFIIGEHGDSELAVWDSSDIGGMKINNFCELRGHFNHEQAMNEIFSGVKNSAYEIIERKGATYYGIAMAVKRICTALVKDEHSILPVSSYIDGEYGLNDICISIPSIVCMKGIDKVLEIPLSKREDENLFNSASKLKDVLESLKL
ncbi:MULTISPECIES: L-lactate dehydrogenase [unclassified Anaerofustis]|uniref:L-lactate dehydrogenase n=1 Tax=Anaerofustis TaxID=264995 RepID=UPI00209C295E|nr:MULTISPECIES: L-lactate dehydrogenase [unclassified Anaerofustis]MCO8192884.1 L-lactate dehydrogenase [Anaerofustis sp. NSJ-163]